MLHPIFSTFLARPNLFLEHLVAYAELTGEGITEAKRSFMLKLVAWVVFAIMIVVTLVVACTSAMLWVIYASPHWIFWVAPGVPFVIAIGALLVIYAMPISSSFSEIKSQIGSDIQVIRESGKSI